MSSRTIAVVGLGYVGLPLAVAFGKVFRTLGIDLSEQKIQSYRRGQDPAGEVSGEDLASADRLSFHTDPEVIRQADFVVVAVPTPVDLAHRPDLTLLRASCDMIGRHLAAGTTVVFESTVYPGATEEVCIPILAETSGLAWKRDFFVGYSPERINPGDKEHTLAKIVKVVSGDTPETRQVVADTYGAIVPAGIHVASSIKVAEAAKVIENTQRDLNIALVNELAIIFHRMGLDTLEVLQAAGTKWNFLGFRPGLVGGHCIGVDPYYLTHKAETLGYHPQVILAGRAINDGMAAYVAQETIKSLINAGCTILGSRVLVLGLTFKEDCTDLRNSKVAEVVRDLTDYGCRLTVHDPLADPSQAQKEYGIELVPWEQVPGTYDAVVAAVPHHTYRAMGLAPILAKLKPGGVFIDLKSAFDAGAIRSAGFRLWRL